VPENGEEHSLGKISSELISRAKDDARTNHLPFAGIVHRAVMQGVRFPVPGQIAAVLEAPDRRYVCAVLRLVSEAKATNPVTTASEPPALQSPSASQPT
jgi:hypothetical protein